MNEEDLGKEIADFYHEADVVPPDSRESARQVKTRLAQVPQVKRRRWLPAWLQRTPDRSTSTPAHDDTTPEVTGRTRSMFSPVTAITAGALVFAVGALLIAQPFQQASITPGAEAEAQEAIWVTGAIEPASTCSGPDLEMDGLVRRERDLECSPQVWTASDPRLTGDVARRWNTDVYSTTDQGFVSIDSDAAYLRNDEGEWVCTGETLLDGYGSGADVIGGPGYTLSCIGEEGYAGLSAKLVAEPVGPGFHEEFVGLIFSGDFPPQP